MTIPITINDGVYGTTLNNIMFDQATVRRRKLQYACGVGRPTRLTWWKRHKMKCVVYPNRLPE
eukprot:scaffold6178_cov180-Amphora_coffeaeformis.AAC.6